MWAQGTMYSIRWGPDILMEGGTLGETYTRHPFGSGRVRASRPPDATSSTQQGRHIAQMRAVATITVPCCALLLKVMPGLDIHTGR